MKKLVSLFIALLLILSLFTVTAVAFAEESTDEPTAETPETRDEVVFNEEAFRALDSYKSLALIHGTDSAFQLDYEWLKDEAKVKSVFVGAKYTLDTTAESEYAVTSDSDKISVETCSPSLDYKEDWTTRKVGANISIGSTGWWGFRYVLKDSNGKVLAKSCRIDIYFGDESVPVINDLSTDMKKVQTEGIKVGFTYTIRTNLSVTDNSSTTTTYVVYKFVNGAWTEEPIYDSTTKVVAEGYGDGISTAGVIKMFKEDVLADNAPVYKIVYTVKDANGYKSNTKDMTIFAVAEEKTVDTLLVWKYVLYSIAALSAIGIVVVLCIKPKNVAQENVDIDK